MMAVTHAPGKEAISLATLIKLQIHTLPQLIVVGKEIRYSMDAHMKGDNRMPALWDECFAAGVFAPLEAQTDMVFDDAYVGIMLDWDRGDGDFSYIVGLLMKPGCAVPEGYAARELTPCEAAVGWIQGKDTQDVCGAAHELTMEALRSQGRSCDSMKWCMELYNCPRFTTPQDNGLIILDYYIPCD